MKTCPSCSAQNDDKQSFCGGCGVQLPETPASKVPLPPTEDAFNYMPLIRTLQFGLIAPAVSALGILSHSDFLTGAGALLLAPMGIAWILFTWRNAALIEASNPVGCRNLKAIFWLQLFAPMLANALASVIGWVAFFPALGLDIALVYWRDKNIGGKFPSQVAIYKLGLEFAVIVLPALATAITAK